MRQDLARRRGRAGARELARGPHRTDRSRGGGGTDRTRAPAGRGAVPERRGVSRGARCHRVRRRAERRAGAERSRPLGLQRAGSRIVDTNLARAEIRSPIDGIVIRRSVEPGQSVAAAFQSPELFLLAEDLDHMEVRVAIDEADIGQVRAGQRAQFTVDAYPNEAFPAVLTEVRNAAELTQNVVTYEAVLAVDNPGLKLRPGMTASVRVITAEEADALLVPNAALRFTPPGHEDSRNHADGVFVVSEGGRPRFVPLTIELTDGAHTSVRGDLVAGEPVLVDLAAAKHGKKG
ncbi:efflux RND transporter periplasmic adaptor subunit [Nannocystis pusilla]|uniref:Efflux RND transporter periplasmic adaptor subunit n=1 Tax=Nannocystis pusilla TaxID=889268 RepID=A0A9X3J2B0_9BACT|nr:efflux RND transporter periplasmic adaptor subunit [Nannocystis pusilla]